MESFMEIVWMSALFLAYLMLLTAVLLLTGKALLAIYSGFRWESLRRSWKAASFIIRSALICSAIALSIILASWGMKKSCIQHARVWQEWAISGKLVNTANCRAWNVVYHRVEQPILDNLR